MALLDLIFRRRGTYLEELNPPPPKTHNVAGCRCLVTFDDGTVLRITHYGRWTVEELWRTHKLYDDITSGVHYSNLFVNGKDPIYVAAGVAYPRHRVRSYVQEVFSHVVPANTHKKATFEYPYEQTEPVQRVEA